MVRVQPTGVVAVVNLVYVRQTRLGMTERQHGSPSVWLDNVHWSAPEL